MADSNLTIGYSPADIKNLMQKLNEKYGDLKSTITTNWDPLKDTMRDEWVGDDEQSAEKALVERLCELYASGAQVVNSLMDNLANAGQSWADFQRGNIMQGSGATEVEASAYTVKAEDYHITDTADILQFEQRSIGDDEARGLKSDGSYGTITDAMKSYVNAIEDEINGIYSEMNSAEAFMGDTQSGAINDYIKAIGEGLSTVETAMGDIKTSLETQINANYSGAQTSVQEGFDSSTVQSEINEALGGDESMKWN